MKGKEERRESRNSGNWQWVFEGRKTQKKMGKKKSMRDPDRLEKMEEMGEGKEKMERMEGRANRGSWGEAKKKKMGNEKYGGRPMWELGGSKKRKKWGTKMEKKKYGGRPIWEFGGEEKINIEERKMGDGQ